MRGEKGSEGRARPHRPRARRSPGPIPGPGPAQRSPAGGTRGAPAPAAANSAAAPCPSRARLPHAPPAAQGRERREGREEPGRGVWRGHPRALEQDSGCAGSSGIAARLLSFSPSPQVYFVCRVRQAPCQPVWVINSPVRAQSGAASPGVIPCQGRGLRLPR